MNVCLVWIGDPGQVETVIDSPGPWRELRTVAPGLLFAETEDTVSRVFHEIKWLLPDDCPLMVTPVSRRPKARLVAQGTVSWLRDRLALPDRD